MVCIIALAQRKLWKICKFVKPRAAGGIDAASILRRTEKSAIISLLIEKGGAALAFNTAGFLFLFFPAAFLLYRLLPGRRTKNLFLALASAVFYGFGGLAQLPVLLAAFLWDYLFGRLIAGNTRRKLWCGVAAAGNLALLGFYKYLAFVLETLGLPALSQPFALPLGISFFTFHGISYLVDVYREPLRVCRRADTLFLYLAFFPRLIAGPIVRWQDAEAQLNDHPTSPEATAAGLRRFVRGLLKKLLLAESAAAVANAVYALAPESLGMGLAWLGAVSYCLQIFFDFSGYSDMAIGIGALFGFTFPENFNYPYISGSVSEFWRRWHMTLNRWFVDYLYVPLGGSRCGKWKTVRNKLIVFFCTGLWHGAGWTYILWGLWHGVLVSAEGLCKAPLEKLRRSRGGRAALHIYTLLAVILGFAMFRAPSVQQGFLLIGRMFSFAGAGAAGLLAAESILTGSRIAALAAGIVLSLPVVPALTRRLTGKGWEIVWDILALFGLLLAILALSGGGFTPFIYQQF